MIAQKQTMSELNTLQPLIDNSQILLTDLKSTSKVSRWRLIFWVAATAIYALDVLMQLAFIDLQAILDNSRFGLLPWYIDTAKKFQYGHSVVTTKLFTGYTTLDESSQIVKLAAAQAIEGKINLKIAKLTAGVPEPLDAGEFTAFKAYFFAVKPPTVNVQYINNVADDLQLTIDAVVDANVLNTTTGELLSTPGTYPLNDKLQEYLNGFGSDAGFNSYFEVMRAQDKMQEAQGIISVYITLAKARDGANPFTTFPQRYNPKAGYFVINQLTVNYTSNV